MKTESDVLKRHPVKTILLLLFLMLLFAEIVLRIAFAVKHYPVGTLAPSWLAFKPVDSLEVWPAYYTDENGIYKASSDFWNQRGWNINSEGFRGREFIPDTLKDSSVSLLFIGDSYTWGAHATPPDSCFVDLLARDHSLACYNAGVPGTDPSQYLQVAKVYVPRLHPRFTLVILYLGNDLMDSVREIVPNKNIYYQTNAGWLPVTYKGRQFDSAQDAYRFVTDKFSTHSWLEEMFLKTAFGTAILTLPMRLEERADWNLKKNSPVTNDYLKRIQKVCESVNSNFYIFIIPREADLIKEFYKNPLQYTIGEYPALMNGLEKVTYIFPFHPEQLYPQPDGHLNNAGHEFAAEFISKAILSGNNTK